MGFGSPHSRWETRGGELAGSESQPCPRRSGPAGRTGRRGAGRAGGAPGGPGPRRRRQPLLHGPGRGGRPRGSHTGSAARAQRPREAGTSVRSASGSAPLRAGGGGELDARDAYRSGGTGAGRAPTQTRVSVIVRNLQKIEADNG